MNVCLKSVNTNVMATQDRCPNFHPDTIIITDRPPGGRVLRDGQATFAQLAVEGTTVVSLLINILLYDKPIFYLICGNNRWKL
ncbi:hypothetical protein DPMN_106522 [Dreissena polymorpha]|uniref:Uncharacterized protein n=1 Tax=Dreissena polymorpha TaxID=45954 RepID=A0A9D4QIZ5_DREPO|nr:hypothetical protein DPMN_106522 [Dreissena polymorpha]